MEEVQQEQQQAMAEQAEMEAIKATPGLMKSPLLDPTKNPNIAAAAQAAQQQAQQPPQE